MHFHCYEKIIQNIVGNEPNYDDWLHCQLKNLHRGFKFRFWQLSEIAVTRSDPKGRPPGKRGPLGPSPRLLAARQNSGSNPN